MLILNYHRVGEPPKTARYRGMFVAPDHLAWQVSALKKFGYSFVTVEEGVASQLRKDLVALTFDDGYLDNLELGLSVLQDAKVPATVYVVTNDVGKKSLAWQESGEQLPADLMDWQDLRKLQRYSWEIGSHAAEHIHLDQHTPEKQLQVISSSWQDFQKHLGRSPATFAYPYGHFNDSTSQILRELNCQAAVTTRPGKNIWGHTPLLELHRLSSKGHEFYHRFTFLKNVWRSR